MSQLPPPLPAGRPVPPPVLPVHRVKIDVWDAQKQAWAVTGKILLYVVLPLILLAVLVCAGLFRAASRIPPVSSPSYGNPPKKMVNRP